MDFITGLTKSFSLIILVGFYISCRDSGKTENKGQTLDKDYEFTNDLIHETSPYLLQHAHNPIDWKPWTEDVFKKASEEDKLVVLSIGYSTCHWCHVMEEESFEDLEVANFMNQNFVNVKVDREERPDLDKVYQTALQLVNGTGGWPMNAIILPDGKPVYLGTYHSKKDWIRVLAKFKEEYGAHPKKMAEYAQLLAQGVQNYYTLPSKGQNNLVSKEILKEGIKAWSTVWDLEWGGDQGMEKFINPHALSVLFDYSFLENDLGAREHVFRTLDLVLHAGIYDHVGGGFFRYSTDDRWKVPHYEKMLYDNAQMIALLSKVYKVNKKEIYKDRVWEILVFLQTQMKNEKGGFYGAMDADTDGEEGLYYLWTEDELRELLKEEFILFSKYFGINEKNRLSNGKYVLHASVSMEEFSRTEGIDKQSLNDKIANWKSILLEFRNKRKLPGKDKKIITSWNALLMDALLDAYKAFGDREFLEEALSVFQYLEENNFKEGVLVHSFIGCQGQKNVFLEDYAFFTKALLNLYEVTLHTKYYDLAKKLLHMAKEEFGSESFMFYYNRDGNQLTPRLVNTIDSEIPSSNAVMAHNLYRLGHLEYNKEYLLKAENMVASIVNDFEEYAQNYASWGTLIMQAKYPYFEVAVVGKDAKSKIEEINAVYLVNTIVAGSTGQNDLALFKDRYFEDGTFIYVCKDNTCKLPVENASKAFSILEGLGHHEINVSTFTNF